ncbi:hypothetical protein LSAT2_018762 [Lamellibrachia satsuma]|nr:hypothetical protein LSAT2_018762 [Lamellibrachia satsuma]
MKETPKVVHVSLAGVMMQVTLTGLLIMALTVYGIAASGCRFARTSASQGSCVFPCRCTKGCNQVTGDCINDGQCKDGRPIGYHWNGTACQIGNVAYKKAIVSETPRLIGSERAVDGNIGRCARVRPDEPEGGWITIDLGTEYSIFRVAAYFGGCYCNRCPSTSTCNDVIGCDECLPGKQQPDCAKGELTGSTAWKIVDDARTTQRVKSQMDDVPVTARHAIPHLKASDKLNVEHITSSSAVVSWLAARSIPPGLETHYYYIVWIEADGKTEKNVARLPHKGSPSTPIVENIQTSACGSIVVNWKPLGDSGCDEVATVRVWYKRQSSKTDEWTYKASEPVNQTSLTIDYLTIEQYDVKVSVTNNKNFVSSSEIVVADFQKFERSGKSASVTASGAGLAVGTFLLGILTGGGGLYFVYRIRRKKWTTNNKRQPNEDIAMENSADVLGDEQDYVNVAQRRDPGDEGNSYEVIRRHNKSATSNTDDFVKGGRIDGGDIEYTTHVLWEPCCCNNEELYLPEAMSSPGFVRPDCRLIARTV